MKITPAHLLLIAAILTCQLIAIISTLHLLITGLFYEGNIITRVLYTNLGFGITSAILILAVLITLLLVSSRDNLSTGFKTGFLCAILIIVALDAVNDLAALFKWKEVYNVTLMIFSCVPMSWW